VGKYLELSDFELLQKIIKKDARALEELYERYSPVLFAIIKKIIGENKSSEEVLIKVFLILWRRANLFPLHTQNVYVWMIYLTRNLSVDTLRRKLEPDSLLVYDDEYEMNYILPVIDPKIDPLDLKTAIDIKQKFDDELNKLTDVQKQIIHLSFYEGYTIEEISEKLFVPLVKVREMISDCVFQLRNNLLSE
jgi:RNA polymerase sigma-70 factor (ECF subfamily)